MSTEQSTDTKVSAHMAGARNRAIAIILTPIVITLVWALWVGLTSAPVKNSSNPIPVVGESIPGFTFPLLSGGTASLSDYRGKVVLVNVWATWCPPCIDEMPDLENLYKQMKSQGLAFEILGVSIDALGADPVNKWVERFGITFPILLDPRASIKKLYRTTGVPETFVIDPAGRLVRKFIGPRKWDGAEMVNFLKSILNASNSKSSK